MTSKCVVKYFFYIYKFLSPSIYFWLLSWWLLLLSMTTILSINSTLDVLLMILHEIWMKQFVTMKLITTATCCLLHIFHWYLFFVLYFFLPLPGLQRECKKGKKCHSHKSCLFITSLQSHTITEDTKKNYFILFYW